MKSESAKAKDRVVTWILEWIETIVVALALALIIRAFLVQVFWIPSGSMEPTLNINDRIIVNKLAYGIQNPLYESFKEKTFLYVIPNPLYDHPIMTSDLPYFINFNKGPKRFDIVVFKLYDANNNRKDLIKRVIGLPGEKLELKKGVVYINDQALTETHPANNNYGNPLSHPATYGPVQIPADSYFVMGDNRPNSADSRYWGFLPKNNIIGPVIMRIWPLTNVGFLPK